MFDPKVRRNDKFSNMQSQCCQTAGIPMQVPRLWPCGRSMAFPDGLGLAWLQASCNKV